MEDVKNLITIVFSWFMNTEIDLGLVSFSLGSFIIALWVFSIALGIICRYFFGGND